jgi:hypothetical protein
VGGLFLLLYACFRSLGEFFREPDADIGFDLWEVITRGQLLSAPMLIIGAALLLQSYYASSKKAATTSKANLAASAVTDASLPQDSGMLVAEDPALGRETQENQTQADQAQENQTQESQTQEAPALEDQAVGQSACEPQWSKAQEAHSPMTETFPPATENSPDTSHETLS